jgi:hypothetical protein
MAFSYVEYVGTVGGTTGPFSYGSVALLDADTESISTQLKVYKNGTLLTLTTDYTIDTINDEVDTVANVFNTDLLRIVRETKGDARYVDYVDSTNITSELLDLDSNQLFFLVQEAIDLQTDAMTVGTDGAWAGRGRKIGNIAAGVNGTDAVTVNQLQAAVTGALPASLSGIGTVVYTGDGSTTAFPLPSAISAITDPSDVEVYINGLRQRPGTHYTIVSTNITITPAPSASDNILVAFPEGAVSAVLTTNTVTTTALQDNAVTVAKIAEGTNGQVIATVAGNTAWTTPTASLITDFDTQVRTNRLDQLTAPTVSVSLNSQRITNLATPTTGTDAATKTYVDDIRNLTCMNTGSALSGSATSVNFSATCGFIAGQFTIQVPITQSGAAHYFSATGVITGSVSTNSPSNPIRVLVPDTDASVGAYFDITYTRTTIGAGSSVAFTVARTAQSGTASNIDLDTTRTALVFLARGSS